MTLRRILVMLRAGAPLKKRRSSRPDETRRVAAPPWHPGDFRKLL